MEIPQKVLSKINKTDTCWLWQGHIDSGGYGVYNGKDVTERYVHRQMFLWANNYIPLKPNVVGHLCEVRNCVNPAHLTEQSQSDNIKQYTTRITKCPSGHEYDSKNTYIRKNGSRKCRECHRQKEAKRRGQ